MYKFNWAGNKGRYYLEPGEVMPVECGICGTQMNVERNVNGSRSFAEAKAGGFLYDRFTCPHFTESWHEKVFDLQMEAIANSAHIEGGEEVVKEFEEKVKQLYEALERAEKKS